MKRVLENWKIRYSHVHVGLKEGQDLWNQGSTPSPKLQGSTPLPSPSPAPFLDFGHLTNDFNLY